MLRLLHVINVLLILPMIALGFMASLSGGGNIPDFQRIGGYFLWVSPLVGIVCPITAELLWRWEQPTAAYLVNLLPIVVWAGLCVWLQLSTGFFF